MPWELQTFVCTACSAETVRHGSDDANMLSSIDSSNTAQAPIAWTVAYDAHTAVVSGETYRIIAYPSASPLAGKYGCYCDGRYVGLREDLVEAKAWCSGLSGIRDSTSVQPA